MRRNLVYDWNEWRSDPRVLAIDSSDMSVEQTVALVEDEVGRRTGR